MQVRPFRGLRPRADLASRVASLPYDVMNADEARQMVRGNPDSFLHVIRAEVDLPAGIDPHDDAVYAQGKLNFEKMIGDGRLVRDAEPAYYLYRLVMDGRAQTGVLGAAAIDDYLEDRIKKHEHTRPAKEQDRIRVNEALSANPGPVFLTYADASRMDATVERLTRADPDVCFTANDGIEHQLWVVVDAADRDEIQSRFAEIGKTYVADGHHRAAAAAKVGQKLREQLKHPTGDEPCNFFLAAHFPARELRVLDYNRVVRDLNGLDAHALADRIEAAGFTVSPDHAERRPPRPGTIGMYLAGNWYLLIASSRVAAEGDLVGRLDVSVLTDRLLRPLLGIDDPRTDSRIDFVGGIRGMDELEQRVDSGRDAVAFTLYPPAIGQVLSVADAGRVMPPKSTWFEPKLRSGLVVQRTDGDRL